MGKRELFIILAFVTLGVAAYELVAPARPAGTPGFSLSQFWRRARQGIHGNPAQATFTHTVTLPANASQHVLQLRGLNRAVKVIGEPRETVAYELSVVSTGPDEATALAYAKRTVLTEDDLGQIVVLRLDAPREGTQWASLVVHVPARLDVRIDGGNGASVTGVATLDLESVSGDVAIAHVAGALSGLHRNGDLQVSGVGRVNLTLQQSHATFEQVAGGLTLDVRNGDLGVRDSKGPIQLEEQGTDVTLTNQAGPIRVNGNNGTITLDAPRDETEVDVRNAEVEIRLPQPVSVTALTTNDTLRLLLGASPTMILDAATTDGKIQTADARLSVETNGGDAHLLHTFGANGPRVSLRNSHGDIVIRRLK